ncbi:MAG: FkbM family methyltransferase [Acidimicrobiales bacterium]
MFKPKLQNIKPALRHAAVAPIIGPLVSIGLGLALTAVERERISFRHVGDGLFRYRFANSAVLYSRDLDMLTPSRLRAEAQRYYLDKLDLQVGDVVIDAGASIGTFAYAAAEAVGPTGQVIAIEAHPQSFAALKKGVDESDFDNIVCVNVALSDRPGTLDIGTSDDYRLSSVIAVEGQTSSVEAVTIDELVARHELGKIDMVKMNIEGAETTALAGATESARAGKIGSLAVSCHDFMFEETGIADYKSREAVAAWLDTCGFDCVWGNQTSSEVPYRDYVWATAR